MKRCEILGFPECTNTPKNQDAVFYRIGNNVYGVSRSLEAEISNGDRKLNDALIKAVEKWLYEKFDENDFSPLVNSPLIGQLTSNCS